MLDRDSLLQTLFSTFEFFPQLSNQEQESFLLQAKLVKLRPGRFICLEGDICQHLPLILSGGIRIYKIGENGREITLYRLGKGDSCIMTASCILSQNNFPAIGVTENDVEAIMIPASTIRDWMVQNPIWQNYIFGLLSQRLANVIEVVNEVAFQRVDCRIARHLLKLAKVNSETIKTTHEEIAQEIGTSREVVSRILKTFEKQELLSLARGSIRLKDLNKLERLAT